MTRPALVLAPVAHPDAERASVYDDTATDAPPLRLTPRDDAPRCPAPEALWLPRGWSGPAVQCVHGDHDQPHAETHGWCVRDTDETRDPSWWRLTLERGGYGRPALRLYAVPSMATMADVERLATVDAGLMAADVRVVLPPEVLVRMPGVGMVFATATDETVEGVPVVGIAETTARKVRAALRGE